MASKDKKLEFYNGHHDGSVSPIGYASEELKNPNLVAVDGLKDMPTYTSKTKDGKVSSGN